MGKFRIGHPSEYTMRAEHLVTMPEITNGFVATDIAELIEEVAPNCPIIRQCQCSPAPTHTETLTIVEKTVDKRARKYGKLLRSRIYQDAQMTAEVHAEMNLNKEAARKAHAQLRKEMESEFSKHSHQLELIEQAMKVQPVHIKETVKLETFDKRLLAMNIVMLMLNLILILKY